MGKSYVRLIGNAFPSPLPTDDAAVFAVRVGCVAKVVVGARGCFVLMPGVLVVAPSMVRIVAEQCLWPA